MAPDIVAAIRAYPEAAKSHFAELRAIILNVAAQTQAVGPITETLKWGQPSYLTRASRSGSTIRLAWSPKYSEQIGVYLNCQTTLIETIRTIYPNTFAYEGNRAILMPLDEIIAANAVEHCVLMALTYHSNKKRDAA